MCFWTDEYEVVFFYLVCKFSIFTKEAISWVNGIGTKLLCYFDNGVTFQVGFTRSGWTYAYCLVCKSDMWCIFVCFRIDCNRLNSHFLGRTHNAKSYFATIGN